MKLTNEDTYNQPVWKSWVLMVLTTGIYFKPITALQNYPSSIRHCSEEFYLKRLYLKSNYTKMVLLELAQENYPANEWDLKEKNHLKRDF